VGNDGLAAISLAESKGKMDHRNDWPHLSTAARESCTIGNGSAQKPTGVAISDRLWSSMVVVGNNLFEIDASWHAKFYLV